MWLTRYCHLLEARLFYRSFWVFKINSESVKLKILRNSKVKLGKGSNGYDNGKDQNIISSEKKKKKKTHWLWCPKELNLIQVLVSTFYVIPSNFLRSFIHPSTRYITSAHYVPTTVLEAKHNEEKNSRTHVLQTSRDYY